MRLGKETVDFHPLHLKVFEIKKDERSLVRLGNVLLF